MTSQIRRLAKMEDLYFLEIHILKVQFICKQAFKKKTPKLTTNINFGTIATFEIKEEEFKYDLLDDETVSALERFPDVGDLDKLGGGCPTAGSPEIPANTFTRLVTDEEKMSKVTIRMCCGSSILFSQNPQGLKQSFELFPMELSVWANVKQEGRECVGVARIPWDSQIVNAVDQAHMCCYHIDPTTIKITEPLCSEVTGSQMGEITLLIRMTCLGKTCVTLFKETNNGQGFIFRNRAQNRSYKCKKYGIDTTPADLKPIGILYETLEIRDPEELDKEHRRRAVSKELKAAGLDEECIMFVTGDRREFGTCDIPFPCGNPECTLIKMIKDYLNRPQAYAITKKIENNCECCDDEPDPCGQGNVVDESKVRCPMLMTACDCEPFEMNYNPCAEFVDHSNCGKCMACCGETKKDNANDIERIVYEGLTKMLSANKNKQ